MSKKRFTKSLNYLNSSKEYASILVEVQKQVGAVYAEKCGVGLAITPCHTAV